MSDILEIEKIFRINNLLDFYQQLLTTKQQKYMQLYYTDDFSLGEIAEEFNVSRQAVYDTIRRSSQLLEEYEEKLHLLKKYNERQMMINELQILAKQENHLQLSQLIQQLATLDET